MKRYKLSKCEKCYYVDTYVGSCDYLLVTGKRRGCSAKKCDKFKPKEEMGKRTELVMPGSNPATVKKQRAMRALYDEGLHDRLIAEKLGCSKASVTQWRHMVGLPPLARPNRKRETVEGKK